MCEHYGDKILLEFGLETSSLAHALLVDDEVEQVLSWWMICS